MQNVIMRRSIAGRGLRDSLRVVWRLSVLQQAVIRIDCSGQQTEHPQVHVGVSSRCGSQSVYSWTANQQGHACAEMYGKGLAQITDLLLFDNRTEEDMALLGKDRAEPSYQTRVQRWAVECFQDPAYLGDVHERAWRFAEEAIELLQSVGMKETDIEELIVRCYSRPAGIPKSEIGAVQLTLATVCSALGLDMRRCAEHELERAWDNIERIRAKNKAKVRGQPLPGPDQPCDGPAKQPETLLQLVQEVFPAAMRGDYGDGWRDWAARAAKACDALRTKP